ncbi:2-oxoglutarate-dependent dioxygenase DAO-like protein isoform X2 [Cinnamomum micranthum f. kanehirae]|uniref:2-oxoglutarate-dependent dioxygenase DAO n=1 Tax=Cinnamomum micranthum f. kanehirae TaxID=337451 RepID=A0A3S3N236_9MAGN|nr:2-oxoglutarate-dependent dioxygenase DAO-like protein isoform X2 [Cinnamomum micranthum f. kanehirae]
MMMGGREEAIPVTIDLDQFPAQSGKLVEACEGLGCFRVVNHKIPLQLMSEMKSVVRSLLDLPAETKLRNTDTIAGSGYVGPTPKNPLYEALGLHDINSSEAVDAFCDQLDATTRQRETIKSYARGMHNLAMDIGHKISQGLGIEGDVCREWPIQFRINKYSFTEESVGSLGVQLHTDSGFLTILQEDECVGGLEVMDKSGQFISIDPMPGSLLVNLGDVAKVWSNGRFCNVKHHVQCKEAVTRITIAVFLLGPVEDEVEAPPELVDADHRRIYLPFTYEGYRKRRLSTGLRAGEALELYTIQNA